MNGCSSGSPGCGHVRVIGHDRLSMSAYIDHVLTLHFGQSDEAIKSLYEKNYEKEYQP